MHESYTSGKKKTTKVDNKMYEERVTAWNKDYLVVTFISQNIDCARFGSLKSNLYNNYLKNVDYHLETPTKAFKLLSKYTPAVVIRVDKPRVQAS